MKRKITAILIACMAMTAAAGCGSKGENAETGTEIPTESDLQESASTSSIDITYNVMDYVTLGDYMNLEVSLKESDYQITEEAVNNYVDQMIAGVKPYVPDESKTVVEKGDIVDVNYVGKKDGVAFEGGSADNQLIDTEANANAEMGSGYIDGFSDGLIDAKVGDTVDSDVTFPEDYGNEELNGQTVTFTFTVNAICKAVTRETMDDAYALENFQVENVEGVYTTANAELEQQIESQKKMDIRSAVMEAVTEVCTVNSLPEGLLDARLAEYIESFRSYYCADGTDLDEFLQANYNTTEEEFTSQNRTNFEERLKQELVFEAIAENEKLELDQEGYDAYISNIVANGYESEDALYESLGSTREAGENYFHKVYLENKACDMVAEKAKVTYTQEEEGTETSEPTEAAESTEE